MRRYLVLLLLLPLIARPQGQKKYPALLWKISGNNLKKPSYLYGTMHVSNRVAYYLSEQFFDALKSVDVVGLETNPGQWLENMEKTGELSELAQFRNEGVGNDFYTSVFNPRFPDKKVLQAALSYDPDIIDGLLYRQTRSQENFEESTYIDLFIYQSASKLNKQLISLEDFSQSEIKARLSAMPDAPEDETDRNRSGYFQLAQKIEDAYREGNLDLLDSLSKLSSSKNTQRYLINDRNEFFVNTIDSVLKTKTLFSGVGAAHLPGNMGVVELLRKKGYVVEPVLPKVTRKSHSTREELDRQFKPVSFQKQTVQDSLFSLSLPGKLYSIINIDNLRYYIYADMVNGSFYTVMRLKHLGRLQGLEPAQIMARVDSLLFESIPGKITSKKEVDAGNGIKGFDISNRTRRGDEQRYQIYFTDAEMIVFKLGGKSNYASGNEARQFFGSISFTPKTEELVNFAPKTKGFSVKVPASFSYMKHDGSSAVGVVEELYAYSRSKKLSYGIKRAVYNDFNYLEDDTFELNRLARNLCLGYNFTVEPRYTLTRENGFPAIRAEAGNNAGQYLCAKLIVKGVHYYLVYTIGNPGEKFDSEFFKSFRLTDFEYVNTLKEITDKDFFFKAVDEVSESALSRFNEAYAKAYEKAVPKKDSLNNDYEYKTGSKFYYSPSSNEYVNITLEKYNDYDFRDKKEVEKKIAENYRNNTTMLLTHAKAEEKNGLYKYTCVLKDTATVRAIDVRIFVKNGLMHLLTAPFDTTIGHHGWLKGFLDSFTPLDTVVGKDIFSNKFASLLADLSGNDTVKRRAADNSLRLSVGMQKAYGDEFVKFISGDKIHKVSEDGRAYLFVNGGTIENEKIIVPYKNLYKHYADSFYLQLCLLKGLACLKTKNSYDAFSQLLQSEAPLVGAEASVKDVFNFLHDSLELCKGFFPGMLNLARYDEYRDAVYTLMADLVNKKLLPVTAYTAQKEAILIDANLALKRYTPGASRNGNEDATFSYLDKQTRELAETLKNNMEGLANNNFYKNLQYANSGDFYTRVPLVNYAYVLAPFYKNDDKVRQWFAKVARQKSQDVAMPVAINLLKYNVVLSDSLLKQYCSNKYTRAFFYSELEKEKVTSYFDKTYLTQQSLVESVLASQKQLNAFYNSERDSRPGAGKKDSLIFLKELPATNKYQKGTIYLFKLHKNKYDDEQWCAAFVAKTRDAVNSKVEIVTPGYYINNAKSEKENEAELLDYFYLYYRKRANAGTE